VPEKTGAAAARILARNHRHPPLLIHRASRVAMVLRAHGIKKIDLPIPPREGETVM
jgi:hypothetical protein